MSWRSIASAGALVIGCGHTDVPASDMICAWRHDTLAWQNAVAMVRGAAGPLSELHAVDLAASQQSTCAIDQAQRLWCWGQFAGEARVKPLKVDLGASVRAIDGNDDGYCAVLVDGTITCFAPEFGSEQRSSDARPATALVMAGAGTMVIRLDDGSFVCQQLDSPCREGEDTKSRPILADGEQVCIAFGTVRRDTGKCPGNPSDVGRIAVLGGRPRGCGDSRRWPDGCDAQVVERATNEADGCELRSDGVVRCAGEYARRLALATGASPLPHLDPYIDVPLREPASKLVAGSAHLCALERSGRVACWGSNGAGQVGLGPSGENVPAGAVAGLRDVVRIGAHRATFCALDRTGGLWCWGEAPAVGHHPRRMCHDRVATPVLVGRVLRPGSVRELAVGEETVCVRREGDDIECFGGWQQLRRRTFPSESGIVWTGQGRVRDIALDDGLCVLRGSVAVCIDNPTCTKDCRDVTWLSEQMLAIDGRCAHNRASDIACWTAWPTSGGPDSFHVAGQIAQMRADRQRWCVRLSDGSVQCDGNKAVPQRISGAGAVDLAVGRYQNCIVTRDEHVGCWPADDAGDDHEVTPHIVAGLRGAIAVAVSTRAACAVRRDGSVACWGGDRQGELARGYIPYALDPLTIVVSEASE